MAGPRKGLNRKFATSAIACERSPAGNGRWIQSPRRLWMALRRLPLETDEIQHAVPWAIDPFLDLDLVALAPFPDDLAISRLSRLRSPQRARTSALLSPVLTRRLPQRSESACACANGSRDSSATRPVRGSERFNA